MDRIAKGDIPEKITDVYAGDFNEIKNNLNECIDAVNLLVVDTNMLVDAAAAGKLTARADVSQHAGGDFAKIVGGINQTFDVINEPFREVNAAIAQLDVTADETTRGGADEIAKAAEQVALTSQQCADLGNSLIIQIEEVDRQVADLSASNEEIASTSQEVHEHAVQTAEIGEKAQKLGAEANAKMTVVEDIAKQSVDGIEDLNSRMQEIDNVVKQVNDITNQINLLALNAAIEAARAGEHGRGFAVVAGEVRNLAVEAKAATGQIDQVIAGVQTISAKTAEAIGSAHTEIGSGVASVNATIGGALNEIVKGSQDMKLNLDEIAKAIEDQANMANRIVEAMEESSRLTRENQGGQVEELASLAEEASASTEEIGSSIYEVKNMAGDLKQTMDKFEV
ncbi:methyl-accepting chemotaxis protein [Methanogenium cariaci]|uniref:methyl-accepting chemotaxis protein n=1 Tax=Methanogenium cariaci TaxID=2197 RepID=UPI00078611EA|nr:methyl-accepting chemotaxis protein [Methanogenium cariaci]